MIRILRDWGAAASYACSPSMPGWKELSSMQDFLIGLAFVGMVLIPAIVATVSARGIDDV